jgi:hypothetical protein
MPRRRWVLALTGAGMKLCLLSGCFFAVAENSDLAPVPDPPPPKAPAPASGTLSQRVASEEEPERFERPAPPAEPAPPATVVEPIAEPTVAPVRPPPDPPAVAALRAYLNPDSEAARQLFARLEKTDREVLDALVPAVIELAGKCEPSHAGPAVVDRVLQQLQLLEDELRQHAPLRISKVCFARNIETFGVYEPLSATEEEPVFHGGLNGRPGDRVQVYVEVRNFASRKVGPFWETALASTLEIRKLDVTETHDGKPDVQLQRPARPDRSLSPRRDYFLNIQFHVPARLPPGRYELKIIANDEIAVADGVRRGDARSAAPPHEHILTFRVEPPR